MSVDKIKMKNGSTITFSADYNPRDLNASWGPIQLSGFANDTSVIFTPDASDPFTGSLNSITFDLDDEEIPLLDEVVNIDDSDDDYLGIDATLLSLGYSQSQVKSLVEQWQQEHHTNRNAKVYLRHSVRLLHLQMHCNWDSLDEKGRRALLWELGINTRTENYYTEHCLVRVTDRAGHGNCGKLAWEEVVFGNERIDTEWVEKRDKRGELVSSFEARTYERRARDYEYDKELCRLGGAL